MRELHQPPRGRQPRTLTVTLAAAVLAALGIMLGSDGTDVSEPTTARAVVGTVHVAHSAAENPGVPVQISVEPIVPLPSAAQEEPDTTSTPPIDPLGERDHYEAFLALAEQRGAGMLLLEAEGVLESDGPDCEKIAVLRAARKVAATKAERLWLWAFTNLPDESRPEGVSIPAFVLRDLERRSARDVQARATLRGIAEGTIRAPSPLLRRQAAARLAQVTSVAVADTADSGHGVRR